MPVARIKATPASRLCMYSGVADLCCLHMSVNLSCRATKKNISVLSILWNGKNEILRNDHKVAETGTGSHPGFKCADFWSSTVGLETTVYSPLAFVYEELFQIQAVTVYLLTYGFS